MGTNRCLEVATVVLMVNQESIWDVEADGLMLQSWLSSLLMFLGSLSNFNSFPDTAGDLLVNSDYYSC
jgi:hypothetical protein